MSRIKLFTGLVLGFGILAGLTAIAGPAAKVEPQPSWYMRFCSDNAFMRLVETNVLTRAKIRLEANRYPFPAGTRRHEPPSTVLGGTFAAPADGDYAFRLEESSNNNAAFQLEVAGRLVAEQPGGVVSLKAGAVPVRVFIRYDRWPYVKSKVKYALAEAEVKVKTPGATEFVPLQTTPDYQLGLENSPARFQHEFEVKDAISRYWGYRSFVIDVPEDGYYRLGFHLQNCTIRWLRAVLDDREFAYEQERRGIDANRRFYGEPDRTGNRRFSRGDFFSRRTVVRHLKKGRHLLDVLAIESPWHNNGDTTMLMTNGSVRVGYDRLEGKNPESETGFWLEDRDDLVYEVGEPFVLQAGSAADLPREYVFEVSNTVSHAIVRTQRLAVRRQVQQFTFDCAEEGAYEYRVYAPDGSVAQGPWAFVVVDSKPVERPRLKPGEAIAPASMKVVDAVDCAAEGPGGPHDFRDSFGSSTVITNHDGIAYRLAGPQAYAGRRLIPLGKPGSLEYQRRDYRPATAAELKQNPWIGQSAAYFDWFAYTLKAPRAGRAYVVRCTLPNDRKRYITSYAFDWKTARYNGWNLLCGDAPAAGPTSYLSYFVWPNAGYIDVMIPNTTGNHGGRLDRRGACCKIELLECDETIPSLPEAAGGWTAAHGLGWMGEQGDLWVNERTMPPLWDGHELIKADEDTHCYHSWNDLLCSWERFGQFSAYRGDSLCMGPVFSYGMQLYQGTAMRLLYPGQDILGKARGSVIIDPIGRDQFKLMLMKCSKWGVKLVADFMLYVPVAEGRQWAEAQGWKGDTSAIFLSERADGKAYTSWTGAFVNNPAHPVYRRTAVRFCEELAKRYGKYPAFGGIRQRYWPGCLEGFDPWWHNEKVGFDDWTVAQFVADRHLQDAKLANVGTNAVAYEARRIDITNRYAKVWREWRDDKVFTLREEMLAAMQKYRPDAMLYVTATNEFKSCHGLGDPRHVGRRDLGYLPEQTLVERFESVEMGGLDGRYFAAFNRRPAPYGNPDHGTNEWISCTYPVGLCCNEGYRCSPYHLARPARYLSQNNLKHLWAGGEWCLPPADEELRRFTCVYRAIPDLAYTQFASPHGTDTEAPYGVWTAVRDGHTVAFIANATDCELEVRLTLKSRAFKVTNLVDGDTEHFVRELVFRLDPFMPAVYEFSNADGIESVAVVALGPALERLQREAKRMLAFEPTCGRFAGCREDAERRTFGELIAPLKRAYAAQDWLAVRRCLYDFQRDHAYWLMVIGYPREENHRVPKQSNLVGNTLSWMLSKKLYVMANKPEDGEFAKVPGFEEHGPFFVSKPGHGPLVEIGGGWGGWRSASFTALFGGGYGPYRVEDKDGKVLWTFPATDEECPHLETRTVPLPITYRFSNSMPVRYVALGPRGGAVHSAALRTVMPKPVCEFRLPDGNLLKTGEDGVIEPPPGVTNLQVMAELKTKQWGALTTTFLSGADRAELFLNGKSLIKRTQATRWNPNANAAAHTGLRPGTNVYELVIHPLPADAPKHPITLRVFEADGLLISTF